jgi:hypothetical protein
MSLPKKEISMGEIIEWSTSILDAIMVSDGQHQVYLSLF